jgi:hypothetical protein
VACGGMLWHVVTCGDMWWYVVVCGGMWMWWYVVVCCMLWYVCLLSGESLFRARTKEGHRKCMRHGDFVSFSIPLHVWKTRRKKQSPRAFYRGKLVENRLSGQEADVVVCCDVLCCVVACCGMSCVDIACVARLGVCGVVWGSVG